MNQNNDKNTPVTKGYKWKPQQYLSHTFYKKRRTFFNSNNIEIDHTSVYRKTQNIKRQTNPKDFILRFSPIKNEEKQIKRRKKSTSKPIAIKFEKSPYISNSLEIEKMLQLLVPVKGPNQSVKIQIKRHNDLNLKNAENLIVKKSQNLFDRMKAYSSRMGLPEDTKIFMMNSRDNHIKQALIQRGWIESGERQSILFHLKWVYKDNPNEYILLQEGQLYNHFKNNQQLTNKNYLRKNIKKMNIEGRPSFPLSFDLQLNDDNTVFQQVFIKFEAFKLLNKIGKYLSENYLALFKKVEKNKLYFINNNYKARQTKPINIQHVLYNGPIDKLKSNMDTWELVTLLFQYVAFIAELIARQKYIIYSVFQLKRQGRDRMRLIKKLQQQMHSRSDQLFQHLSSFYIVEIIKMWVHAKQLCSSYGFDNMWILKPTGVSRGSGITITNDIIKIIQGRFGKIVQKYIEYPLLLDCKRKFDIRQWVLVRSFSPLRAYAYRRCYARFSSVKYSNDKYENMQKHLTNYSQNKQSYFRQKWQCKDNLPNLLNSSVMSQEQLAAKIGGQWIGIKQKIYADIVRTLNCCRAEVISREGCFEVYGFDIMLDQDYKSSVLEVNLSPACEQRQFLGDYLEEMAEGLVDMIEGSQPSGWTILSNDQIQSKSITKRRIYTGEQEAILIQKWWRKRSKDLGRIAKTQ